MQVREQPSPSWLESVFAPLWRIFHIDRYGVVSGVEIDLRHADLGPWDWQIDTMWTDPDWGWQQGPKLWFPWFGPFDEVNRCWQALRWAETSAHTYEAWAARLLPVAEVTAGCRVEVAEVRRSSFEGRVFDHEHDAEIRLASVRLVHPNGRAQYFEQPP